MFYLFFAVKNGAKVVFCTNDGKRMNARLRVEYWILIVNNYW